jgi:hypothetical protein
MAEISLVDLARKLGATVVSRTLPDGRQEVSVFANERAEGKQIWIGEVD